MHPRLTLSVLCLIALSTSVQAGPEVRRDIGIDVNNSTTPVFKDVGTVIRETRRNGGSTLRCWQEGRLFYEGSGFRAGVPPGNGVVLRRDGEGEVTLFDFRNGLCILSSN